MIYITNNYPCYFIMLVFNYILFGKAVNSNLYKSFENKFDDTSNYFQKKIKREMNEIYRNSGKLLNEQLNHNKKDEKKYTWNSNDLYNLKRIQKLIQTFGPCDTRSYSNFHNKNKLKRSVKRKNLLRKNIYKRFDSNSSPIETRNFLNSIPQLYPNVMASSSNINIPSLNPTSEVVRIQKKLFPNSYAQVYVPRKSKPNQSVNLNFSTSRSNEKIFRDFENIIDSSLERIKHMELSCKQKPNDYNTSTGILSDNQHLSLVLDKVFNELEAIRLCKYDNNSQNGYPCDITGSWNSEVIGLQFDISPNPDGKDFSVHLKERYPAKRHNLLETDWKSVGSAIHKLGGPFFMTSKKCEENSIATFAGLCKVCGGVDMIFGTWTFVRPAKNCEDIQVAIETRRDVFRRSVLEERKRKRFETLKRHKARNEMT